MTEPVHQEAVSEYVFPNNSRRRIPGLIYLVAAAVCAGVWAWQSDASPLVNGGYLLTALLLVALGAYHLVAGSDLAVDERDALVAAGGAVDFPLGHASAQVSWRGLLSRPTWRVLVYSGEEVPRYRGLVLVDGRDGSIVEYFVEENPEDWSELTG